MNYKCRVCLESVSKLYPLNGQIVNCEQTISTMITYCTSVEIEICDDLPVGVCVPCFKTIRIAYNFILQFKQNHQKLLDERQEMDKDNVPELDEQDLVKVIDVDKLDTEKSDEYKVEENNEQIVYELVEQQDLKPEPEGYDYQEIDLEQIEFLVNNVDDNSTSSNTENCINSVVEVIKTVPSPSIEQPKTVVRRKIKMTFTCPVCPRMFFASFESGLVPHMSLHDEYFPCNICNDPTEYNSDSFLNHFMKYHRFQCPYCGKSFNRTGTLTAHIKTHSTFRYACTVEGCSKTFPTQWSRRKHEAIHSNSCAYVCNKCKLEFKTYDTYMYHQKKHSGKKFLCMCCGRTFMQSVHLKYHMQQHTGIKQFQCDLCDKSYTSSSQLKKHKRRHHSEQVESIIIDNVEVDHEYVLEDTT